MLDLFVIALYMAAMIAIGWFSKRRASTESDYLVAGRRLGPMLYAGTMAALVMGGGASTRPAATTRGSKGGASIRYPAV